MKKKTNYKAPVKEYRILLDEVYKKYGYPGECKDSRAQILDISELARRSAVRKIFKEDAIEHEMGSK